MSWVGEEKTREESLESVEWRDQQLEYPLRWTLLWYCTRSCRSQLLRQVAFHLSWHVLRDRRSASVGLPRHRTNSRESFLRWGCCDCVVKMRMSNQRLADDCPGT